MGRIWRPGRGSKGLAALMRMDWLGGVCSRSKQDGLAKRAVGGLFCPFVGRDGKAGLAYESIFVQKSIIV